MTLKNNVTQVQFGKLNRLQLRELIQWDKGQKIEFLDDYIIDGTEVQFYNDELEETINKVVQDKTVAVPDELLESHLQIYASVKVIQPDSETTVKRLVIPVHASKKPSGYTAPEDEPTFRQIILDIFNKTKAIAQSVRDDANAGKFKGDKGDKGDKGEPGDAYEPIYIDKVTGEKYRLVVSEGNMYMEKVDV